MKACPQAEPGATPGEEPTYPHPLASLLHVARRLVSRRSPPAPGQPGDRGQVGPTLVDHRERTGAPSGARAKAAADDSCRNRRRSRPGSSSVGAVGTGGRWPPTAPAALSLRPFRRPFGRSAGGAVAALLHVLVELRAVAG